MHRPAKPCHRARRQPRYAQCGAVITACALHRRWEGRVKLPLSASLTCTWCTSERKVPESTSNRAARGYSLPARLGDSTEYGGATVFIFANHDPDYNLKNAHRPQQVAAQSELERQSQHFAFDISMGCSLFIRVFFLI